MKTHQTNKGEPLAVASVRSFSLAPRAMVRDELPRD